MWVFAACCHGYSWSLMHSVTFLRGRLTLGAVFVWAQLWECVGGIFFPLFFFLCVCILRESEREQCSPEAAADRWTSLFCFSGPQQPPGGFGAAPCLPGGQEDEGVECRHKVRVPVAKHRSRSKSRGNFGLVSRPVAINQLIVWQNELQNIHLQDFSFLSLFFLWKSQWQKSLVWCSGLN